MPASTLLRSSILVLLVCHLPQATGQTTSRRAAQDASKTEEQDSFIYYDYVEDGVLKGGMVAVDPNNPLMTDIPDPNQNIVASSYETVLDNGPPGNRVNLVFVGDGFTSAELGLYAAEVESIYPAFLAEHPLDAYASYFNIYRVDVISNESGVDNDPIQGISRDTALNMGYWCGGTERLLCVSVNKAKVQARSAPAANQILAIANSSKYGGAGYNDLGTLAGNNSSTVELALHEFGHSFPGLADEYDYGGSTNYNGPQPIEWNVTILTEPQLLSLKKKWYRWLDLPNISVFEGARYSQFGIWRPTSNSKMRNLGRPFEEVNAERFIREIYKRVDPIDAASPPGTYTSADALFVTPMRPPFHTLDIQWSINNTPIPGATGETLDLSQLPFRVGAYAVSVTVVDNTPLMRNVTNRNNLMTSTRSWTVLSNVHPRKFR